MPDSVPFHTTTSLDLLQRARDYGDGLFETIRLLDGEAPLLEGHWQRLSAGLHALDYAIPTDWDAGFFYREIEKTGLRNARIRLSVWRSPGGLYAPESRTPLFRIQTQPLDSEQWTWKEPGLILGVSSRVRLPVDTFSRFKTLNAPRYVAASLEAREHHWDDALVLNNWERICEATSSNVFWWEGDNLCTIPVSEGCVAGVMRACLLAWAEIHGISVQHRPARTADLEQADEIFLTNAVRGVVSVQNFTGRALPNDKTSRLFNTFAPQIRTTSPVLNWKATL